mgnify:CR=1 FL=1
MNEETDETAEQKPESTHHLFRVRLHKGVWAKLKRISVIETAHHRMHVSISDIARLAINDWIATFEAAERLGAMRPPAVQSE